MKLKNLAAALAFLAMPTAAQATMVTIDFDGFVAGTPVVSLAEDGITMTWVGFGDQPFIAFYAAGGGNDGNGFFDSNTDNPFGAEAVFSAGGKVMNLISYDLIREGPDGLFRIDVAGLSYSGFGGDTVLHVDRNLMGITSFNVNSVSAEGNYGIDNIVIEVIPEPGSLALLGLGLAGLGAIRRKRA